MRRSVLVVRQDGCVPFLPHRRAKSAADLAPGKEPPSSNDDALALKTVETLLTRSAQFDEFSLLESAEVVRIAGEPGVLITWTQTTTDQGARKFGLIMSMSELARSLHGAADWPSDFDGWIVDLVEAVREPHGTSAPEHVRTWFREFP